MTPDTKRRRAKVIPFLAPKEKPKEEFNRLVTGFMREVVELMRETGVRLRVVETKVEALMIVADRPNGTPETRP